MDKKAQELLKELKAEIEAYKTSMKRESAYRKLAGDVGKPQPKPTSK